MKKLLLAAVAALVLVPNAFAHAELSPPVAKAKALQLFTLAVPTEQANATTTTIEFTPPQGFGIDSFVPVQGWKQDVQSSGSGDSAVVTKVTWSGGKTPTGDDSVFQFLASPSSVKTYAFTVRQTYSDGSVVEWAGPESSDTPAPRVQAVSSLGGGGSSSLAIVALVVAAAALLVAAAGLLGGKRSLA
jgi:uncharacterized protein YcnI